MLNKEAIIEAAKRADAFDPNQLVEILRDTDIEDLDDLMNQLRHDHPCLFKARVLE